MLLANVDIIIVKDLKLPYEFKPIYSDKQIITSYYRKYVTGRVIGIRKSQLKNIPLVSTANVILKQNNNLYWCPLLDELYKAVRTEPSRNSIINSLRITRENKQVILIIVSKKIMYKTSEVVKLKAHDKSYQLRNNEDLP